LQFFWLCRRSGTCNDTLGLLCGFGRVAGQRTGKIRCDNDADESSKLHSVIPAIPLIFSRCRETGGQSNAGLKQHWHSTNGVPDAYSLFAMASYQLLCAAES
jgi:hypothetical protein